MKQLVLAGLLSLPLVAQAQTFGPALHFPLPFSASQVGALATADFNNDGYPDIALADNGNTHAIDVLLSTPGSTFAAPTRYPVSALAVLQDVAAADVNRDGYADIVFTNVVGQAGVLLNNKNGTFAAAATYPSGANTRSVTLGDVNNDGYADLVGAQDDFATITVLLNRHNGTFGVATRYPTGPVRTVDAAVVDVNNDGYADIVAAILGGQVGVLLNNKSGGFTPLVPYAAGTGNRTTSIKAGDFDKDGYADLVTTDYSTHTIAVLRNNHNGTFAAAQVYSTGRDSAPAEVAVGDVNGDGYVDVVTANGGTPDVSVLLNDQLGAFAPDKPVALETTSVGVALADVNQDGKLDIVTADGSRGSVSLLLNSTVLAARTPVFQQAQSSIWPNPVAGPATLTVTGLPAEVRRLEATLIDAAGRVLQHTSFLPLDGLGQVPLSTGGLAAGLYLLQLTGHDAQGVAVGVLRTQRISVR